MKLVYTTENDVFTTCCNVLDNAVTLFIPRLNIALQHWHTTKRKTIGPCQRPRPRPLSDYKDCSENGKPTSALSCASCVAWGIAVENVFYPETSKDNISWGNINPMCLAGSHVMVAKAFVDQLQRPHMCIKLDRLDPTSLLMLMMSFREFHRGSETTYDIIKEVLSLNLFKKAIIRHHQHGFKPQT